MIHLLAAIAIGFVSGVLSGAFGIGGGIVTTPAIRLLLSAPALVAVGTPLPVILPSALTGAFRYRREGLANVRAAVLMASTGAPAAVAGALLASRVGGTIVLAGTALLILWAAADMSVQAFAPAARSVNGRAGEGYPLRVPAMLAIGAITGLYSGFFGLGGGFVLVPLMTRWLKFPIKLALGTSLATVALLAVPGTVTHALLGNIDWGIAAGLTLGVVPGAALGAHFTLGAADRTVRIAYAVLLMAVGVWLGVAELLGVPS